MILGEREAQVGSLLDQIPGLHEARNISGLLCKAPWSKLSDATEGLHSSECKTPMLERHQP